MTPLEDLRERCAQVADIWAATNPITDSRDARIIARAMSGAGTSIAAIIRTIELPDDDLPAGAVAALLNRLDDEEARAEEAEAQCRRLEEALRLRQSYGCPATGTCGGHCDQADCPVVPCPMEAATAALAQEGEERTEPKPVAWRMREHANAPWILTEVDPAAMPSRAGYEVEPLYSGGGR